jgi:hypothetical protein
VKSLPHPIRVTSVTLRGQPIDTPEARQELARALMKLPAVRVPLGRPA